MSSATDPTPPTLPHRRPSALGALRRRITATWIVGIALCVGISTWAFWLPAPSTDTQSLSFDGDRGSRGVTPPVGTLSPAPPIDPKLLAVRLWNAPPAPERNADADSKSPVKALNLQLVGIIDDADGIKRAALYDVDADRLFIVADGERVGVGTGAQTVKQVLAREVTLSNGTVTRRLVLADGGSS